MNCRHLAIFIDGPLVGTMSQLPIGTKSWEVQDFQPQLGLGLYPTELLVKAVVLKTVTYRPVMVGIGANAGLWAINDDISALDEFIKLIWPVLKLAESIERMGIL